MTYRNRCALRDVGHRIALALACSTILLIVFGGIQ